MLATAKGLELSMLPSLPASSLITYTTKTDRIESGSSPCNMKPVKRRVRRGAILGLAYFTFLIWCKPLALLADNFLTKT